MSSITKQPVVITIDGPAGVGKSTAAGNDIALETILSRQQERNASDEGRSVGPLKPAADAIMLDTTRLTAEQVIDIMETLVRERRNG